MGRNLQEWVGVTAFQANEWLGFKGYDTLVNVLKKN